MRHVTAMLSAAAIVLMASGVPAQGKPSFGGEWTRDVQLGEGVFPEVDLTITQGATAMTVEYKGGQAPVSGKLTYKLDGSVSKNMVSGRGGGAPAEQVSKAMWAGNNVVVKTTTGAGEETRTFSVDDDHLVVETSTPARTGPARNSTKVIYKKYERGHGG